MNAKHTPGPWRSASGLPVRLAGRLWEKLVSQDRTTIVALVARTEDARLIAAAPEMAEELSEALDIMRTIIGSGAVKTAKHIPDNQKDAIQVELHNRIASIRTLLTRIDGPEAV